jgi:iron complex outermembrane receptor protein
MQYRAECGLFARADLLGTGSFYGDAANQAKQNAYTTVNFQLGYKFDSFDFRLLQTSKFIAQPLIPVKPFQGPRFLRAVPSPSAPGSSPAHHP